MRRFLFSTMMSLLLVSAGGLSAGDIPVTDPNVQKGLSPYNWISTDTFIGSAVCGASIKVGFGSTRNVALSVDTAHLVSLAPSRYPILGWTVNGGRPQTHQLTPGEKTVPLATSAFNPVIDLYVKGMSPFEDRFTGDVPFNSVKITGFTVDTGGVTRAAEQPKGIWFNIGDSIMSGDAADYEKGKGRPPDDLWAASDDARASYGWLLASHYGFREARVSYGGYAWAGGAAKTPGLSQLIDQKTSTVSRLNAAGDKLEPPPAVVLINLGENGIPADADVISALQKMRSRVSPKTALILMIPVSGRGEAELQRAFKTYQESSPDPNATVLDLGKLNFATADGQHPAAKGHEAIYRAALPKLDPLMRGASVSAFK